MERLKNTILGILTGICVVVLFTIIISFGMKKLSEQYLKEEKIKKVISDIKVVDLLKDASGKETKLLKDIKEKLTDSGIPTDAVEEFLNSKPINKYTSNKVSESIEYIIHNKHEKLIKEGEIYTLLDDNIEEISNELKERSIEKSEVLTEEYQQEFLEKVKDKTPEIEEKINELQDKIYDKLDKEYVGSFEKQIELAKFIYNNLLDLILITTALVFVIGIMITRRSIYRSFKWIGVAFILAGTVFMILPVFIDRANKHVDTFSDVLNNYIKTSLTNMKKVFSSDGVICLVIGILLIVLNIAIYIILEKIDNRKYEKNL